MCRLAAILVRVLYAVIAQYRGTCMWKYSGLFPVLDAVLLHENAGNILSAKFIHNKRVLAYISPHSYSAPLYRKGGSVKSLPCFYLSFRKHGIIGNAPLGIPHATRLPRHEAPDAKLTGDLYRCILDTTRFCDFKSVMEEAEAQIRRTRVRCCSCAFGRRTVFLRVVECRSFAALRTTRRRSA